MHYCVANTHGAEPYTSTIALTNVTLPFILKLANNGWEHACKLDESLCKGVSIVKGEVMYKEINEAFEL